MRRGPKFSLFQPWVERSSFSKTNGDKLRLLSSGDGDAGQDRKANLKLAWFFATVAVLLVLADQVGRVQKQTDANFAPDSTALVSLKVLSPVRFGNGSSFSMRFQLSNRGNHSVFYPISTTTRAPVGQLVARTSRHRIGQAYPVPRTSELLQYGTLRARISLGLRCPQVVGSMANFLTRANLP